MDERPQPHPTRERTPGRLPGRRIAWGQELLLLAGVTLLLTGADQWTKGWAVDRLGPLQKSAAGRFHPPPDRPPLEVWEGALRFNLTGNSGAIFGLGRSMRESVKKPLFAALSGLAMVFIASLVLASRPEQRLRRLGLSAVLSGALGNLIDRIGQDYVVDFIDWYGGFHWPTFNVADIAITVGVVLTLLDLWLHPDPLPPDPLPQAEDPAPEEGALDPTSPSVSRGEDAGATQESGPTPSQGPPV